MIIFKEWNDELLIKSGTNVVCPKRAISEEEVINDNEKPILQQNGFTHCYCIEYEKEFGSIAGSFDKFKQQSEAVDKDYCGEWKDTREN